MSSTAPTLPTFDGPPRTLENSLPFYYGWVNVVLASLAMTATLPGRTHGLGLITEPLLTSLGLDRLSYSQINLASSLTGAAFCLPIGWFIDRFGVRTVLVAVTAALGFSVIGMAEVGGGASLFLALVLVRGFGQSALSIVSIAMIGKWFRRRLGIAMGVFAVLLTIGFIGSVLAMGSAIETWGWRLAWQNLGWALLALTPAFALFVRSTPERCGVRADEAPVIEQNEDRLVRDFTLRGALRTPAFWVLALGSSAFNLVWSGVTLFNESMLAERGFDAGVAVEIMAILTGVGLLANLVAGALATRARVIKLMGVAMALLAGALAMFPTIDGKTGIYLYASAIGFSGGVITVVFFAAWGHLFGRAQLGRIQGGAQLATVLASALGPVVMAQGQQWTGSYAPTFYGLALVVALLAIVSFVTPMPKNTAPP